MFPTGIHVLNNIKIAVIAPRFKSLKKHTYAAIGERLNIPLSNFANICRVYEEPGTVENYHGGGDKLKFNTTEGQNLNCSVRCTAEARR